MERFAEKLRHARKKAGLTQAELAEKIGVSSRAFTDYECGRMVPRPAKIEKIAKILGVSAAYLTNDTIDDISFGLHAENKIEEVKKIYATPAAGEMAALLERNTAFLAGKETPMDMKEKFFEALMSVYITCKQEADKSGKQ